MVERFAIIGLGRFGARLATSLARAGVEVIGIDKSREIVEELRDQVTLAIAMDATDEGALRLQGIDQVDTAIVGMGRNFEATAMATALLKSLRVKRVIARAGNPMQARILQRIGADSIVSPEDESADRWSHKLLMPYIIDHVELGSGYALAQLPTPEPWRGKKLAELDLRNKHKVTIVAIKRRVASATSTGAENYDERVVDLPQPDSVIGADDTLILAGFDKDIERLPH